MANLTSSSTFQQTVMGNKRVVIGDVPATGSTSDTIVFPMQVIEWVTANWRGAGAAFTSLNPVPGVSGTSVNIFRDAATTAIAYTVVAYGR